MHVDIALVQLLKLKILVNQTIILLLASSGMMVGILLLNKTNYLKALKYCIHNITRYLLHK